MNRKIRILFLDQNLDGGGAERVLCTIMRSLAPERYEVHLLLLGRLGALAEDIPASVHVHELAKRNSRKALFSFIGKVKRIRPQIVFTSLIRTGVVAVLGRFFCEGFKIIARYPTMPSKEIGDAGGIDWRWWLQRGLIRRADVVIAQTDEMAAELRCHCKIDGKAIAVIHNPVDHRLIHQALQGSGNPFGQGRINLVAAGRLSFEKGFDVLLAAMRGVVAKYPSVRLHILGKDCRGTRAELAAYVKANQLGAHVVFEGFVKNPYPFYRHCDAYVLSSRYEGMPNALCECLYLNRPVVATRCVPIVERLIRDGENGCLASPDDAASLETAIDRALTLHLTASGTYRRLQARSIAKVKALIDAA